MQQSENTGTWENYGVAGVSMTWVNPHPRRHPWEDFKRKALYRRDFMICSLNDVPVITTPTELDMDPARQLGPAILAASADATVVVVDMTATILLDCAALGVLMRTRQRLEENGVELRVASSTAQPRWLLAEWGDDRQIRVFDTLPEAVTAAPVTVRAETWQPLTRAA
jgi:anti-anti-sigma factor